MPAAQKDPEAFRTIGELSEELGVAQHILRYWETKFPQLRPLQRAGNRRYYRAADVQLARRIHHLLNHEGYTVRGVQKLLNDRSRAAPDEELEDTVAARVAVSPVTSETPEPEPSAFESSDGTRQPSIDVERLLDLRNRLADALD